MLRFQPDSWLEGLLRPFIMIDSQSGITLEQSAPDLRYAALVIMFAVAALAGRVPRALQPRQRFLLVALTLLFYVWTFSIGNGRYFVLGILLAGPALAIAARALPGSATLRGIALGGIALLQAAVLSDVYTAGQWGLTQWRRGPGIEVAEHPLRHQPAVFLVAGGVSFSVLVPAFHPLSRWSNIGGQRELSRDNIEWPHLQRLLSSGLPIWTVVPQPNSAMVGDRRLSDVALRLTNGALAPLGRSVADAPCELITSPLRPEYYKDLPTAGAQGFWFCPTVAAAAGEAVAVRPSNAPDDLDALFDALERRCPRFFPPGDGRLTLMRDFAMRYYINSDVRAYVEYDGRVLYKYWRSLNPTVVGKLDEVRSGRFQLECDKLPGRYRFPWADRD